MRGYKYRLSLAYFILVMILFIGAGLSITLESRGAEGFFYPLVVLTLPWSIIAVFLLLWLGPHSDYYPIAVLLAFPLAGLVNGGFIFLFSNIARPEWKKE